MKNMIKNLIKQSDGFGFDPYTGLIDEENFGLWPSGGGKDALEPFGFCEDKVPIKPGGLWPNGGYGGLYPDGWFDSKDFGLEPFGW